MATYYEMGRRGSAEVWRSLRGKRARPPVPSGSKRRLETFQAALEQSEQQFRAATNIDPDSRAVNLFYGLSQAGRAIAAAHPALGNGDWQLDKHGLFHPPSNDTVKDIRAVVVNTSRKPSETQDDDGSSFRRLSVLLDSHQPPSVSLAEVWTHIYDTQYGPRLGDTIYAPLPVHGRSDHLPHGDLVAQSATLTVPDALRHMPVAERPILAAYLARYPALAGWIETAPHGGDVGWPGANSPYDFLWAKPEDLETDHVLRPRLVPYRGLVMAMPTLQGADRALHPLMAWWLVLYSLSMLTRYQPDTWTRMIDVNRSADATAIEYLLEVAVTAVPDIIDETIDVIATLGTPR